MCMYQEVSEFFKSYKKLKITCSRGILTDRKRFVCVFVSLILSPSLSWKNSFLSLPFCLSLSLVFVIEESQELG